jgi:hypothetical protein
MLSVKLFRLVFCLFQFNRNIETLCFGIEPKQPKQTKTNRNKLNNPKVFEKIPKYALYRPVSVALLFVLVQLELRNKTFVSDSAETSFGSSFGCFEMKL